MATLTFERAYETILEEPNMEMRLYPPVRRTVLTYGTPQENFLPFPYIVFLRKLCSNKWYFLTRLMGEKPNVPIELPTVEPSLSCSFNYGLFKTTTEDQAIFQFPFLGRGPICLNNFYHYSMPLSFSFDRMISDFWSTPFPPYFNTGLKKLGGSLRAWQNLTIDEVVETHKKAAESLEATFKNFLIFATAIEWNI